MRDEVLAAGLTINGLPIMLTRAYATDPSIPNLDVYYEDCVIGGPGFSSSQSRSANSSTRRPAPSWSRRSPACTKPRLLPVQARSRVYCS